MWQSDVHGLLQVTVGDADPGWVSRGNVFHVLGVGVRELSLYLQVSGQLCVYRIWGCEEMGVGGSESSGLTEC